MRFSAATLLSLPVLAAAQQDAIFDHLGSQFEKALNFIPRPGTAYTFETLPGSKPIHALTLNNWNETLQSSLKPGATEPAEWFILITGGNKTCFGMCDSLDRAYREAAVELKEDPTAPNLAVIDCDAQPVLCNSWSAGPPGMWAVEITPQPPTNIHLVGLNVSVISSKDFTTLHTEKEWKNKRLHDGYFHPFDGSFRQNGAAVPLGYFFWIMNLFPSWMMMIFISFISRSMMNRTVGGLQGRAAEQAGAAGPGGRVPGAPAGDGVKY